VYRRAEFFKSDGRIDVVANDGFSGFDIASEKASGCFTARPAPEIAGGGFGVLAVKIL
jgi:hypothetical protein